MESVARFDALVDYLDCIMKLGSVAFLRTMYGFDEFDYLSLSQSNPLTFVKKCERILAANL